MKNPVLSKDIEFDGVYKISMSVQGTVNKTGFLTLLLLFAAGWAWQNVNSVSSPLIWAALIGGFVTALLIIFSPVKAPWLSPIYAILEGVALGGVSASFRGQGIVQNAVLSTLGVLVCMLVLYKLRIIKVTQQFVAGVLIATGGICFVYIMDLVLIMVCVFLIYIRVGGSEY